MNDPNIYKSHCCLRSKFFTSEFSNEEFEFLIIETTMALEYIKVIHLVRTHQNGEILISF